MSAPAVYSFPEGAELLELERARLPVLASSYAGNRILPITEENTDSILWEIRDDVRGLTFAIGGNEEFPVVPDAGINRYLMTPGRFGESKVLDAQKIERMRQPGTFNEPISVDGEMARMQEELGIREQVLIEYIRWQLFTQGIVNVPKKDGTTQQVAKYDVQQFTPGTAWNNLGASAPIADLMGIRTQFAGYGFNFGQGAVAFGNATTIDYVVKNQNPADLYGMRLAGLAIPLGIADFNQIGVLRGIASLEYYDETYIDVNGAVQRFLPDGKIVLVGQRRGTIEAGQYVMTRNANNPNGAPGLYVNSGLPEKAPKIPWTERGHNGGPRVNYTRQIILINAF